MPVHAAWVSVSDWPTTAAPETVGTVLETGTATPTLYSPPLSIAEHSSSLVQLIPVSADVPGIGSISHGVAVSCGLPASDSPALSTATHSVVSGQEIAARAFPGSIETGDAPVGVNGLNVTCCPMPSTAVHWVSLGHDTATSAFPGSTADGA